jgi:hypothetical protein
MTDPLKDLAPPVSTDLFLLGHRLDAYQRDHGLDDAALALHLGCSLNALTRLRLCRTPLTGADLRTVVRYFGIDPNRLAPIVGLPTGPVIHTLLTSNGTNAFPFCVSQLMQ